MRSKKLIVAFSIAVGLFLGSFLPAGDLLAQAQRTTTGVVWLVPPVNLTAGGGTDVVRAGGLLFTGRTATDNATVNTWNVVSQAISASTLNTNGQTLEFQVAILGANNTNTHEYQAYFSASSATCSGTGAALCDTGCIVVPSITNTAAFAGETLHVTITRTGSSTQDYGREAFGASTAITAGTCSITDTGASKLVIGTRNTTASAASLAQISYWVKFY